MCVAKRLEPKVGNEPHSAYEEKLNEALKHLLSALQLLDDACAPADIGAHLDLALNRLKSVLG